MTRTITCNEISQAVARLSRESNLFLPDDVRAQIEAALLREDAPLARSVLQSILRNHAIAAESGLPLCQDTGIAVVFLEIGQEVHIEGGFLYDAVQSGVARGYTENHLRKSIVRHPWLGGNTGDNTPAVLHTEITPGDQLKITLMPKGAGAENHAALSLFTPAQGLTAAKAFILESVKKAGSSACPPLVVGVGIGGNFELAPLLAKKALCRPLCQRNPLPEVRALEDELLRAINALGIGPAGLGGNTTALAVAIEIHPCHIASFPVAVNLNCHVSRHRSVIL